MAKWNGEAVRSVLAVGLAALSVAVATASGCNGNVIVDHGTGGSGGSGGNGGAGATVTAVTNVTSSVTSSVSTSITTSVSTGTFSSSSGPSECDFTGQCETDETGNGCVQCAVEGPCAAAVNECLNSMECIEFNDCMGQCAPAPGDPQSWDKCWDQCITAWPNGAPGYQKYLFCAVCVQCASDCGQYSYICPIK